MIIALRFSVIVSIVVFVVIVRVQKFAVVNLILFLLAAVTKIGALVLESKSSKVIKLR